MTYDTPQALRVALEQRLLNRSRETRISLDRLRRRVIFERIVSRMHSAEPGRWVLKGGMALEVRLRDNARLTKDIDLGLRETEIDAEALRDRIIEALATDRDGDGFVLTAGPLRPMREDGGGHLTWRINVAASLAGRHFGGIQIDVSPREHELRATDRVQLPNSLDFAGVTTPIIEIVDISRHAAEKLHAMLKDFGEHENSRVRDLVDLVILSEHELLVATKVAAAAREVWAERDGTAPPALLPELPSSWRERYEQLAADSDLAASSLAEAVAVVAGLWDTMFASEET